MGTEGVRAGEKEGRLHEALVDLAEEARRFSTEDPGRWLLIVFEVVDLMFGIAMLLWLAAVAVAAVVALVWLVVG